MGLAFSPKALKIAAECRYQNSGGERLVFEYKAARQCAQSGKRCKQTLSSRAGAEHKLLEVSNR